MGGFRSASLRAVLGGVAVCAAGLLAGLLAGVFGVAFAGVWGPDWAAWSGVWGCRCGVRLGPRLGERRGCCGAAVGLVWLLRGGVCAVCGSRGGCARLGAALWGCGGDGFLFVARVGAVFGVS